MIINACDAEKFELKNYDTTKDLNPKQIKKNLQPRYMAWLSNNKTDCSTKRIGVQSHKTTFLSKILSKFHKESKNNFKSFNFTALPDDALGLVFNFLPLNDQTNIRLLNSRFKKIVDEKTCFWKKIEQLKLNEIAKPILAGFGSVEKIQSLPFLPPGLLGSDSIINTLANLQKKGISIIRSLDTDGSFVLGFLLKNEINDRDFFIKMHELTSLSKHKVKWVTECLPETDLPRPFDYEINANSTSETVMDKDCSYKISELIAGRLISAGLILEDKFLTYKL